MLQDLYGNPRTSQSDTIYLAIVKNQSGSRIFASVEWMKEENLYQGTYIAPQLPGLYTLYVSILSPGDVSSNSLAAYVTYLPSSVFNDRIVRDILYQEQSYNSCLEWRARHNRFFDVRPNSHFSVYFTQFYFQCQVDRIYPASNSSSLHNVRRCVRNS